MKKRMTKEEVIQMMEDDLAKLFERDFKQEPGLVPDCFRMQGEWITITLDDAE